MENKTYTYDSWAIKDREGNLPEECSYQPTEEQPPQFTIDDYDKLCWFVNKVNSKKHEIETLKKNSTNIISQRENELERFMTFFEPQARREALRHVQEGKKSVKTFYGTLQFRTVKAGIEIVDAKAIPQEFMKEIITFKPNTDALKKAILIDGESIPGVESRPEEERLYIAD